MRPQPAIADVARAIGAASALTESTFIPIGEALGTSIERLTMQAERFELVLSELGGDHLSQALGTLSRTAELLSGTDRSWSGGSGGFHRLVDLTEAVASRVARMTSSLGDVDVLAINAKIAVAHIRASGVDFSGFADEIARTLTIARQSMASFSTELADLRRNLTDARSGQTRFEQQQKDSAASIARRLTATVEIIARQNQRAARATRVVKQRSVNVRQRIGQAVMALQIGDITRQRLEHLSYALGLLDDSAADVWRSPNDGEHFSDTIVIRHLQSLQCADAAGAFDREVGRIADSLRGLTDEARALLTLGGSAYGTADHGESSVIAALEDQAGEALALFESFEAARAEVTRVTAEVTDTAARLHDHLRNVEALEADIRIMGLNTTFKCARIGREGLALSLIAQELRTYGGGFAKEAGVLVGEVETISTLTGGLLGGTGTDQPALAGAGTREIQDAVATLRRAGEMLDASLTDLRRDTEQVVASLDRTVTELAVRDRIGGALRDAAEALSAAEWIGSSLSVEPTPAAQRMLDSIASGYTMASERGVHEKLFGRSVAQVDADVEDVLF